MDKTQQFSDEQRAAILRNFFDSRVTALITKYIQAQERAALDSLQSGVKEEESIEKLKALGCFRKLLSAWSIEIGKPIDYE